MWDKLIGIRVQSVIVMTKTVKPDFTTKHVWGKDEQNLNRIVNKYDVNDPTETIYVMSMIDNHDVKTEKQVIEQIENHKNGGCGKSDCWTQMNSDLDDRANIMYESQMKEFGEYRYTKETCIQYLKDLYSRKSIEGQTMETKAIRQLSEKSGFRYKKATDGIDNKYAVDIVVESNEKEVMCGIQVKPDSYEKMNDKELKTINNSKNRRYDYPVYYLVYDTDNEQKEFKNIYAVIEQIEQLAIDTIK